jgi:predicted phosphodiesterase
MRYGIFSDVHSNLEALEAVLAAYKREAIDRYLCIGDIIGYAANPHECLALVQKTVSASVAGNHDWAAVNKFSLDYFNPYAKEAVIENTSHLSRQDCLYLENLALIYKDSLICLVHGTLDEPQDFHYLSDANQAIQTARLMQGRFCFVGHSHSPKVFMVKEDDSIYEITASLVKTRKHDKYIINVGSVGQPRDGDPRASYCIFDSDREEILIKRVSYDISATQKKIREANLAEFLATRLSFGR